MPRRILIMGAAGRDFHNFNVAYRGKPGVEVVAFTATQIPFIDDRTYPASLAGEGYPRGIPIHDESELTQLIKQRGIDDVVFSYSDISHTYVMHKASQVLAAGGNFVLLGPHETMLSATVPVVAVCAVRTGSGKSQTTRAIAHTLKAAGKRVVAVRHPMPYGNLEAQRVQRYATLDDLDRYDTTIEEREEYEPHITSGTIVYAGVDYGEILEQAQAECDVLLWDGGNNDLPFYTPDVHIVVADPLRAGHETSYHPGEANLRMADVIVINKMDSASREQVNALMDTIHQVNPGATDIVDPRPWAIGTIGETFRKYDVGPVLPAMGYSDGQLAEMERIIDSADADVVLIGTPIDLRRVIEIRKPALRVRYDLEVLPGSPNLRDVLTPVLT